MDCRLRYDKGGGYNRLLRTKRERIDWIVATKEGIG